MPPPLDATAIGALTKEEFSQLEALQDAARRANAAITRPTPAPFPWAQDFRTCGITGTNGKSSTAHMIAHVLHEVGQRALLRSTLGYWIDGVPLERPAGRGAFFTAAKLAHASGARACVGEVTSAALAQGYAKVWRYDVGVFTNLSRDHLTAHGSWEHYLASKAQLFVHLPPGEAAILNAGDPASALLDAVTPADVRRRYFYVPSRGPQHHAAELEALSVTVTVDGTLVRLGDSETSAGFGGELQIPMIGEIYSENMLAAALAALELGVDAPAVSSALRSFPGVAGRFEVIARRPVVAVDYAHSPDALERTCQSARRIAGSGRVIMVFGAGGGADPGKRQPMGEVVGRNADVAVVTSDNPRDDDPAQIASEVASGAAGHPATVHVILDRADAIRAAIQMAQESDVVVIAGKGHESGQTMAGAVLPFSDVEVARGALGR